MGQAQGRSAVASGADKKAMIVDLQGYLDDVKQKEDLAKRRFEAGQARARPPLRWSIAVWKPRCG